MKLFKKKLTFLKYFIFVLVATLTLPLQAAENVNPIQYIPISVGDIFFVIPIVDPSLPPDPGNIGTLTVAGTDSDADGLRDDIQRYIAIKFWNDVPAKKIIERQARSMLNAMNNSASFMIVRKELDVLIESSRCLVALHGITARREENELKAEIFNTIDRLQAWDSANVQMDGRITRWVDPVLNPPVCN